MNKGWKKSLAAKWVLNSWTRLFLVSHHVDRRAQVNLSSSSSNLLSFSNRKEEEEKEGKGELCQGIASATTTFPFIQVSCCCYCCYHLCSLSKLIHSVFTSAFFQFPFYQNGPKIECGWGAATSHGPPGNFPQCRPPAAMPKPMLQCAAEPWAHRRHQKSSVHSAEIEMCFANAVQGVLSATTARPVHRPAALWPQRWGFFSRFDLNQKPGRWTGPLWTQFSQELKGALLWYFLCAINSKLPLQKCIIWLYFQLRKKWGQCCDHSLWFTN